MSELPTGGRRRGGRPDRIFPEPARRAALVLVLRGELSVEQAAERFGCALPTGYLALRRLREELAGQGGRGA